MRRRGLIAVGAAATALAIGLVLLLSSATAQARSEAIGPAHRGDALGALGVLSDLVEHRAAGEAWAVAVDGTAVVDGDEIRTDATGRAEVLYADGSVTRLDVATEFAVVRLAGDSIAPEIRVQLDVGQTYNEVRDVTGQRGSYVVETPVGTAAVRGTIFVIACDDRPVCTFTVLEGEIEIVTLDGQVLVVGAGEELTLGLADDDGGPAVFAGGGSGDPASPFGGGGFDGGRGQPAPLTGGGTGGGPSGAPGGGPLPASPFDGAAGTVVVVGRETPGVDAIADRPWVADNLTRTDTAVSTTGRAPVTGEADNCAVTLAGRNVALATSPDTAIEVPHDEEVTIVAAASGPLDRYRIDIYLADLSFVAASGEVEPDDKGDRTTFKGTADVGQYARWGSGLYEVRARTTGTVCDLTAYINVTGGPPLASGVSLAAIVAIAVAAGGLASAVDGSLTVASLDEAASTLAADPSLLTAKATTPTMTAGPVLTPPSTTTAKGTGTSSWFST